MTDPAMTIRLALTDAEIAACFPVLRELRPHLAEDGFLSRIRRQEKAGYHLAFVGQAADVVAVAGFRVAENLAWGRFLYVDDLVTLPAQRSTGLGQQLLDWLRAYASRAGCDQLHLDSGVQRKDAHRFYEREGLAISSFHFAENLPASAPEPDDRA